MTGKDKVSYCEIVESLFGFYTEVVSKTQEIYRYRFPKPSDMDSKAYERILKNKSFDVARYLLPLATMTSLGQVTSARTIERQISRLLSSSYSEVREIGTYIKQACIEPSWGISGEGPPVASSLVKHAAGETFSLAISSIMNEIIPILGIKEYNNKSNGVELTIVNDPVVSAIAKLIYSHSNYTFRQCVDAVDSMAQDEKEDLVKEIFSVRNVHDLFPKEFQGNQLNFDITCDIGAGRDIHRHRRTEIIRQPYSLGDGIDIPYMVTSTGDFADVKRLFVQAENCLRVGLLCSNIPMGTEPYTYTLGTRCRQLHSMDIAQLAYVTELRSKQGGHFSYRKIANMMCQAAIDEFPLLKDTIRVSPFEEELLGGIV